MSKRLSPSSDFGGSSRITWKTFFAFAKAVSTFTRTLRPTLKHDSFKNVEAMDLSGLPIPEIFQASDGHEIAYRHYHAQSARVAVVLIHGAGCFGDQLHVLASAIAEQDCADAYTLDMRGHGLSQGRRGHAVGDGAELAHDIAEFIEAVRAGPGSPKVVLGGHSAGGGLVLALSRTRVAGSIAGYLFIAPFLGLGSVVDRPHFGGWVALRPWPLRALAVANLVGITAFNDTSVVDFDVAAAAPDHRYVADWSFATLLAFGPGCWNAGAEPIPPSVPVIVVAGSGDECFVQPLYREAFKTVAPQASIPDIGTAGHWDVLVDPAAITEIIRWLDIFIEVPVVPMQAPAPPEPPASLDSAKGVASKAIGLRANHSLDCGLCAGVTALLVLLSASSGHAQQVPAPQTLPVENAYVRLGLAGVIFEPDATFSVAGQKVPAANVSLSSSATVTGEVGYYVLPSVSVSVTGGFPPKTHIYGTGPLAPYSQLGSARYGTAIGLADYHFNRSGCFQPWIGAGPAFLLILSTHDDAIQDLKVSNRWGGALQVGANYMLTTRWGAYVSVTQTFLGSQGRGSFGPYAVETKLILDPIALQAGIELRF